MQYLDEYSLKVPGQNHPTERLIFQKELIPTVPLNHGVYSAHPSKQESQLPQTMAACLLLTVLSQIKQLGFFSIGPGLTSKSWMSEISGSHRHKWPHLVQHIWDIRIQDMDWAANQRFAFRAKIIPGQNIPSQSTFVVQGEISRLAWNMTDKLILCSSLTCRR